jgi:hypothetical protein
MAFAAPLDGDQAQFYRLGENAIQGLGGVGLPAPAGRHFNHKLLSVLGAVVAATGGLKTAGSVSGHAFQACRTQRLIPRPLGPDPGADGG